MAKIRCLTTFVIFLILFYTRSLWFPAISGIVTTIVAAGISWFIACPLCKHVILKKIIPRVHTDGKAVLITGCDTGFGNALAFELNGLGFHVFACCLSDKSAGANDLLTNCRTPSKMTVIQMDVTKSDDVVRALEEVSSQLQSGGLLLHAVVNNAGILTCGGIEWRKTDDVEDYQKMLDVNLLGLIRVSRTFLPLIRKSKGRIVNLTSIQARNNLHCINAYCVSKTAASKFTDGLQQEVSKFSIKAINVEPWFFATPLLKSDYVRDSMKHAWLQAPVEARDAYGTQSYQKACNDLVFMCTHPFNVDPEPQVVVADIVDALTSYEPSLNYRVIGWDKSAIFWLINDFLPFDLIPGSRRLLQSLIPNSSK